MNFFHTKYFYENEPINRLKTKPEVEEKTLVLENLKKQIEKIDNCELKKNSNRIVFGDGNYNSEIMIIGEAPGQKEDILGKPFVGDAGILLDKMLKAISLDRRNVYITNVVNFRPPNNRKPLSTEILRYLEFLKDHVLIINPKIIILMGSTAMEALYSASTKISKERGEWKEIHIKNKLFKTMITFHPAYLLRQPEQKKYSWEDLKKIRKQLDKLKINPQ